MKKRNYWTKERCLEESLKYKSRSDFQKYNKSAYSSARRNKWLDYVCDHMNSNRKPRGYWTFDKCKIEANKYGSRLELKKNSKSFYVSRSNGWLDIFFGKTNILPNGYWTKDRCLEESSKYENRREFRLNSKAYPIMVKNNWLHEMLIDKPGHKPRGYWTKDRCLEESLKYETKSEFMKNNTSAYLITINNKWIDELCSHMKPLGNIYKRCIYAVEFSDNFVYIGLTYNLERRFKSHIRMSKNNRSVVYKHIIKTGLSHIVNQLSEYIDVKDASILEGEKLKEYMKNGWNILNISKCGALGGNKLFWTKERVIEESRKYKKREEFKRNSSGAWSSAQRNGWLSELLIQ